MPVTCVDLSHYQAGFNFDQFKAGGGLGVILKASEALFRDPSYSSFWDQAMDAKLAVASYHFLRPGDMKAQAQFFLNVVKPRQGERVVADYEIPDVSLANLLTFLQGIRASRPDLAADGLFRKSDQAGAGQEAQRLARRQYVALACPIHRGRTIVADCNLAGLEFLAIHLGRLRARLQPSIGLRSLQRRRRQISSSGWGRRPARSRSGRARRTTRRALWRN